MTSNTPFSQPPPFFYLHISPLILSRGHTFFTPNLLRCHSFQLQVYVFIILFCPTSAKHSLLIHSYAVLYTVCHSPPKITPQHSEKCRSCNDSQSIVLHRIGAAYCTPSPLILRSQAFLLWIPSRYHWTGCIGSPYAKVRKAYWFLCKYWTASTPEILDGCSVRRRFFFAVFAEVVRASP